MLWQKLHAFAQVWQAVLLSMHLWSHTEPCLSPGLRTDCHLWYAPSMQPWYTLRILKGLIVPPHPHFLEQSVGGAWKLPDGGNFTSWRGPLSLLPFHWPALKMCPKAKRMPLEKNYTLLTNNISCFADGNEAFLYRISPFQTVLIWITAEFYGGTVTSKGALNKSLLSQSTTPFPSINQKVWLHKQRGKTAFVYINTASLYQKERLQRKASKGLIVSRPWGSNSTWWPDFQ